MNLEPLNQLKLFGLNKQFDDLLNLYSLGKFPNKIYESPLWVNFPNFVVLLF